MLNAKINNREVEFNNGTKIIDLLTEEEKNESYVCNIDGCTKELTYALTKKNDGANIITLNLDSLEAGKAYEATLRFVIAYAFWRLDKNIHIKFSYFMSRSIFCQILEPEHNILHYVDDLKEEVNKIIKENIAIERMVTSIDEAKELYASVGSTDKCEIFPYRSEPIAHLYRCNDYYDYMYSYMLPSTGYLKNYLIHPYSPGIIIQYPRYELGAEIPKFKEEANYTRALFQAGKWGKKTDTASIRGINNKIESGNLLDFIQMCEAKHTNMLADLGHNIKLQAENIRLICIAGPSSSGKTTFCNRLRIELMSKGINPVMISMDDYYMEKEKLCEIQNTTMDKLDLEHINCLDIELFNKNLFDLINGEEVTLPRYNFQTGKREVGRTIKINETTPIMIEGIHALNPKLTTSIPRHQKYNIYIAPQMQINIDNHNPLSTTDLRLIRRIVRDMKFRNCPAIETLKMWPSVRQGEFKWIYPNQESADFVFNSELTYELCVFKKYVIPELKQITQDSPYYVIANRLIKYLKYFKEIEDESAIPCNSLIREFIGNSCFNL